MYSPDDPINLRKKGHKSIALHNILRRLDLLYEGKYSFQIDSKPKEGCRIRLSIPLDKEDGHV